MSGPVVWLARHGETEWSKLGKHTGRTDVPLTPAGQKEALALGDLLRGEPFKLVKSSPRRRALQTAELAGFKPEVDNDVVEWDYGDFEGLTTDEIRTTYSGWTVWDGPWPGGETPLEVAERADRVVEGILTLPAGSSALLFSHQHFLRVLTARWLRQPPALGRFFVLVTGTASVLGWERVTPVIKHWSIPPQGASPLILPGRHR
jgi:broad specificity phosphatase PhoE